MVHGSLRSNAWRPAACIASAAAAGIHLGAVGEHLDEWAPAGLFMLAAGTYQLGWAIAVARGARRDAAVAGALINIAIVGVWLLSRTVGLPFGPEPWMREHIHAGDAIATALEVGIVAVVLGPAVLRTPAIAGLAARFAVLGALASMVTTSHGLPRESVIAVATLALAGAITTYAAVAPRLHARPTLGRDDELISYARIDHGGAAVAGTGFVGAGS